MAPLIKYIRRLVIFIFGGTLTIAGLILIPLPGPGLLIAFLGLSVLAIEFEWARHHVKRSKKALRQLGKKSKRFTK